MLRTEAWWLSRMMGGILFRQRMGWMVATAVMTVALLFGVLPYEDAWLNEIRHVSGSEQRAVWKAVAGWMSYWGDFGTFTLLLSAGILFSGWWRRSLHLKRLAVATILAATFAGTMANVLRSGLGRPRPRSGLVDGLYGPSLKSEFHSLPSAHTATAFGSSLPVLIAAPHVGVPLILFAGGVSWSRMHLNQHHPTDVIVGAWIAVLFGLPLGLAVRRRRLNGDMETDLETADEPVEMGEAVKA